MERVLQGCLRFAAAKPRQATGDYYDERLIPGASLKLASWNQWILPRANQVSTGHLVAPVIALVPPFSNPSSLYQAKKLTAYAVSFLLACVV